MSLSKESFKSSLSKIGIDANSELCERLEIFSSMLKEWSEVHNLTGDNSDRAIMSNIIDSLYPVKFVKNPDSMLDVGTGAGYPGLILSAYWSDTSVLLAEPRIKRASFLRLCALEMGLESVKVVRKRVEELNEPPVDLITSRAVSETSLLLKLTDKISNKNSRYLFYKGENVIDESKNIPDYLDYKIVSFNSRKYLYLYPKE